MNAVDKLNDMSKNTQVVLGWIIIAGVSVVSYKFGKRSGRNS